MLYSCGNLSIFYPSGNLSIAYIVYPCGDLPILYPCGELLQKSNLNVRQPCKLQSRPTSNLNAFAYRGKDLLGIGSHFFLLFMSVCYPLHWSPNSNNDMHIKCEMTGSTWSTTS